MPPEAAWSGPLAVLAAPTGAVAPEAAADIVRRLYGITADAAPLRSERDRNFELRALDGVRFVLKLSNAAQDPAVSLFQTRALRHVACIAPQLSAPRVVPTLDGDAECLWQGEDGRSCVGRLVTYVPGLPLADHPRRTAQAGHVGRFAATLDRALRGFFDPAAGHAIVWDLKHAGEIVGLLPCIGSGRDRKLAAAALGRFVEAVLPRLPSLRAQVIHNDLNPHNILVDPDDPDRPFGIIDFGDMVHSALVNEVAIAAAYLIDEGPDPLARLRHFVAGYNAVTPLEDEEITLLPDLIATRHALTCAITAWRAARNPDNATYILRNRGAAMVGLETLTALGRDAVTAELRAACGPGGPA